MPQVASPRSSVMEREQSILRRFLSFAKSLANESPDETGWVASTVKRYITDRKRDGDHDWANYVEEELNSFRKLLLKQQYKLNITVLVYPLAPDPPTQPCQLHLPIEEEDADLVCTQLFFVQLKLSVSCEFFSRR